MRCAESPPPVVSLPCQWSSPHVPPSYSAPFSTSIVLPFCLRMDLDCSIVPELNDEPASALMDGDAEVHQYEAGTLVGSFVKHRQGWRGPLACVSSSACASACFQGFGKGVLDADRGGRACCDDRIDRGHSTDGSAAEKTALPARVKRVHYPLFAAFARLRPVESSRVATFA